MEAVISIVDDDGSVRDALQRMLSAHGYATAAFASAEQFLTSDVRSCAACVILDVRMPGMTGTALRNLKAAEGDLTPIILGTARPSRREEQRAVANGAVSYLAKPLREEVLLDTVREALEHRRAAAAGIQSERHTSGI
jgi:FixJ family two-component response regulator